MSCFVATEAAFITTTTNRNERAKEGPNERFFVADVINGQ